jgi:hypothetical protein
MVLHRGSHGLARAAFRLALAFLFAAPPAASQQTSVIADSLRSLEAARGEALLRADTAALSRMVAAEFVEISRLGQLRPRAANMADIGSGRMKLLSVKYDSLVVRLYGDVAVMTGIADNAGTYGGFPFSGRIRYLRVFVRRDGRWQAVAMQQTNAQ